MSKTPYEIRLEILKMAQEFEMHRYHGDRETIISDWMAQIDYARSLNKAPPEVPTMPDFPKQEKLVETAKFLSEFVNNPSKTVG
jgi:hypothetical protein